MHGLMLVKVGCVGERVTNGDTGVIETCGSPSMLPGYSPASGYWLRGLRSVAALIRTCAYIFLQGFGFPSLGSLE